MYSLTRFPVSLLVLLALFGTTQLPALEVMAPQTSPIIASPIAEPAPEMPLLPISERDYTFGYWLNGMRKHPDDRSADVLCLESGHFGFSLNLSDLTTARLGTYALPLSYTEALEAGAERLEELKPVELAIELESKGTIFRAVTCKASQSQNERSRRLQNAWLWESGQLAQHYELLGLEFEDAHGRPLGVNGSLSLLAWPNSLSLTADITPSLIYEAGWHEGVVNNGLCVIDKPWKVAHDDRLEYPEMSIECWVKIPESLKSPAQGYLLAKNGHEGSHGHYSFKIVHGRVSANMNIVTGADGRRSIGQRGNSFKDDAWNHLAMTYDGEEMRFYINGALQGVEALVAQRRPGSGDLMLGQRADGAGGVTQAVYDEVRVWDRALTQQELQAHAKTPDSLPNTLGLKYYETFDSYGAEQVRIPEWSDVTMRLRVDGNEIEKKVDGIWALGQKHQLSLNCKLGPDALPPQDLVSIQVSAPDDAPYPVIFDPSYNSYVAEVRRRNRGWQTGYTDIRNYDEFDVVVENHGTDAVMVPFMFYLRNPAQITGMCPILCDADGVPTGIPVQLSKNWHYAKLGAYFRGYMQLPAARGKSTYKLRIPYGFYGTLPSASHAQLSLVGYGGLGRWDQLAIGCWGETICFDMDMSCVDVAITDVRMLMARNGKDGQKWGWTDAGWGGDWLSVKDAQQQKLLFSEMKTAYLAHGPCLSEVRYDGHYGREREVEIQAKVQTLRTDDYARTFQTFKYTFDRKLDASQGWLMKMGRTSNSVSPRIAYGNTDGLILEETVPSTLRKGELFLDRVELSGESPWWVGFPGGYLTGNRDWGTGSRGWVIRAYRASFGGKTYTNPSISMSVRQIYPDHGVNLDLLLTPPAGVTEFLPGDFVEMEIEWMTFHREADDYYGPNEVYREHLTQNPRSWKTIYREAAGNNLKVEVTGGRVVHPYPIVVEAEEALVRVQIEGGCGKVPIRFEGLKSATGYTLYQIIDSEAVVFDQSVHGNDFWQTDYDPATKRFKRTYNLPLDQGGASEWLLRAE